MQVELVSTDAAANGPTNIAERTGQCAAGLPKEFDTMTRTVPTASCWPTISNVAPPQIGPAEDLIRLLQAF